MSSNVLPFPQAPQTQGVDPATMLSQVLGQNQTELSSLAAKAATPIPGGHTGELPLSMQPTAKQAPQASMIPTQGVVGRKQGRNVGIGNAVIGAMNAISGVSTAVDNKKKLEVASATHTLLVAQQAADQAKQILQTDPNNAAAKDAIDHNTKIMNGILSDDKMRKAIAKGFNVDFTDPQANNTLEHQGVNQGKEMATKTLSYADQFNAKTPTVMQPNVQAQAQLQAKLQESKINTEAMRAFIPLVTAQLRNQAMANRDEANLSKEQLKENHEDALTYVKSQDQWAQLQAKLAAQKDLQNSKFGQALALQNHKANLDLSEFNAKLTMKNSDPTALLKSYNDFTVKQATTTANLTSNVSKLEGEKAAYEAQFKGITGGKPDPQVLQSYDDQINTSKQALTSFKAASEGSINYYNKLVGGSNGSKQSSNESSGTGKLGDASTYLNGPDDSTIDDTDEDDN